MCGAIRYKNNDLYTRDEPDGRSSTENMEERWAKGGSRLSTPYKFEDIFTMIYI
jgi:hypothetical protein